MSQLPNPTTPPTNQTEENVTSIQDVCDAYGVDPSADSGGSAGGVMSDIPDGTVKSMWEVGKLDKLINLFMFKTTLSQSKWHHILYQ